MNNVIDMFEWLTDCKELMRQKHEARFYSVSGPAKIIKLDLIPLKSGTLYTMTFNNRELVKFKRFKNANI